MTKKRFGHMLPAVVGLAAAALAASACGPGGDGAGHAETDRLPGSVRFTG
ncbi:hypothetical protein [Streptomyces sp. NPDC006610]|jgi:hypothetical protein